MTKLRKAEKTNPSRREKAETKLRRQICLGQKRLSAQKGTKQARSLQAICD